MLTVITSIQLCTQQHNSTKGKKKKSLKGTRIGKKKIDLLYSQLTYLTAYKENAKKKNLQMNSWEHTSTRMVDVRKITNIKRGNYVEQSNTHSLLVGKKNGITTLWHSNPTTRYLPKRYKNIYPPKDLDNNTNCCFIPKSPNLKRAQVFINKNIYK